MKYSLVVQGGNNGSAAVVNGSFSTFAPDAPPEGLVDGCLAAIMIRDSYKWNPLLIQQIKAQANYTLRYERIENGIRMPAVYDRFTSLSVLFDPVTYLHHTIRSFEDHPMLGPSTNDLRVYNYTSITGFMLPHRFKVIYNNQYLITDFLDDNISINPSVPATFFDSPTNIAPFNVLVVESERTAEIGEQYNDYIYFARFNRTLEELDAQQMFPDMPGVWIVRLPGVERYRQVLLEMEDYVIVMDAPSDQAHLLIEWSMQRLGKPIRQVWPTHHHHDHALGVKTYVEAGAEVVVPEMAGKYYANIPGIRFATYKRGEPYVAETATFRASYIHVEGGVHAQDHSIGVIMPACPTNESSVAVFDADHVVQDDLLSTHNNHVEVGELIAALAKHRVAKSALLVLVHGVMANMTSVFEANGYEFPEYTPLNFEYLGGDCTAA